ncbi:MAG: GNAT family N-acetyltransferase [Janthinobacterium lividum]
MAVVQHQEAAELTFRIEPLALSHDRAAFSCREQLLTDYITGDKAWRDATQRNASVYCLIDDTAAVKGYYTLSVGSIARDSIARALYGAKWQDKRSDKFKVFERFPYPAIGVIVLGRIAIDTSLAGRKIGSRLIGHALRAAVALSEKAGARLVYLDAKNEALVKMYEAIGFQSLPDNPLTMFILIDTLVSAASQTN